MQVFCFQQLKINLVFGKVMIYKLTQIHYQMQAEIYPDLLGRGDIDQRRVKPYVRGNHS